MSSKVCMHVEYSMVLRAFVREYLIQCFSTQVHPPSTAGAITGGFHNCYYGWYCGCNFRFGKKKRKTAAGTQNSWRFTRTSANCILSRQCFAHQPLLRKEC